jgi:FlaA1/EpsC-like NDP-sugar epimerase
LRVFNTYGDPKDEFSFIEKIIKAKKESKNIPMINNGIGVRDFVHLSDVARFYNNFLKNEYPNGIYDIGTGKGYIIKDLFDFVKFNRQKIINLKKVEEIDYSIANLEYLKNKNKKINFKSLELYLKKNLKLKNSTILKKQIHISNSKPINPGIVIYGAGFSGKKIFEELKRNNENILYFIDDNKEKQNTYLFDIPIISFQNLIQIARNQNIKTVYLTIPSLSKKKIINKIDQIRKYFFDVRYLPEKKFLISDYISVNDLKLDEINFILNRKQIKIKKIKSLRNKNILITGAAGTIGSEISRQLTHQNVKKIIGIDNSELQLYKIQKKVSTNLLKYYLLDIKEKKLLEKIIINEKIDIIFHTAAYKHLNILENNIFSAVQNNIINTYELCELVTKHNCEMIFISTDKAASPRSILGYTKRVAEKICQNFSQKLSNNKRISVVRFGNVFGSSGSAIENFMDKINSREPLEITSKKATRFFMTTQEACHLILQTTAIKIKNKIFVLNMGKPVNIFSLARNLAKFKNRISSNYKFQYKITGLKKGEKIHEKIFDKNENKKKFNNEIFIVSNKKKLINFDKYYEKLLNYFTQYDTNKLENIIKLICKY